MDYGLSQYDLPDINLSIIFIYLLLIFGFVFLILLFRNIFKYFIKKTSYFDHVIYLIRLPKEKPNKEEKEFNAQSIKEEIAKTEMIFASIGGLRAQRGIKAWLFGRNDHFGFEVVASHKKIAFYMIAPRNMSRYLEQQIHAYFPEAIIEDVEDYNIFQPNSTIKGAYLKTNRSFIFPIKTYQKQETDPMNSIINIMSKLRADEGMVVQYIVRSAKFSWHSKSSSITKEVHKGKDISKVLHGSKILSVLGEVADAAKTDNKLNNSDDLNNNKKSTMEDEMLKGIEEKNSKAGLDVNLRIIVSSENKEQANMYLDNIVGAFSQYNYYEFGNSFSNKLFYSSQKNIINNFIYRRFSSREYFLLNTEELASIYHLPLRTAETPNILWLTAKHAAAPSDIPDEGVFLGENIYRGVNKKIRISRDDRRRHMYIVGKSGGGKSQFMANMAVQDILNGEGVCVLDPHGDLVNDVLCRVPAERAEDVIVFAPADIERPLALNLIEFDPRYPEQKTFVINEMIKIFDKLYDLKASGGPIFEQYMRNALLLIMSDPETGSTLMEVPKVLADADFRRMKLENCDDPTVVDFWRKEAEKAGGEAALANVVPYVTSKLTQFISNDTMRPIVGQQKSSFNIRDIMDAQKILLVDLSKGQVGEMNAHLLGMIIIGKILMAALSRTDMPQEKRKDFYLYVDEFQNFTTDSICSILSEARKYALNLIIAHQYLGQLSKGQDTSIKDAVFGNVGTWGLFKIGSEDAEVLEKEFGPTFNQYDLINIEKYTLYIKLLIDNTTSKPFSMGSPWPIAGNPDEDMLNKIKSLSRLKYGQDRRIIEEEIRKRIELAQKK